MTQQANNASSNDPAQVPTSAAPFPTPVVIQMNAADVQESIESIMADVIATQMPRSTSQGGPVVVQISADQLKQAVRDGIAEMQSDAVACSRSAIVNAITLPLRALSDWAHWLKYGDVDPDAFGKPAGSKVWPQTAG
jgi:hypothetical protein